MFTLTLLDTTFIFLDMSPSSLSVALIFSIWLNACPFSKVTSKAVITGFSPKSLTLTFIDFSVVLLSLSVTV